MPRGPHLFDRLSAVTRTRLGSQRCSFHTTALAVANGSGLTKTIDLVNIAIQRSGCYLPIPDPPRGIRTLSSVRSGTEMGLRVSRPLSGLPFEGRNDAGSSRIPLHPACRAPHHLAVLRSSDAVGCSHRPRHVPDQAAHNFTVPAATGPAAEASHLQSSRQRHVAHADFGRP
jgi:hypothetical protein